MYEVIPLPYLLARSVSLSRGADCCQNVSRAKSPRESLLRLFYADHKVDDRLPRAHHPLSGKRDRLSTTSYSAGRSRCAISTSCRLLHGFDSFLHGEYRRRLDTLAGAARRKSH